MKGKDWAGRVNEIIKQGDQLGGLCGTSGGIMASGSSSRFLTWGSGQGSLSLNKSTSFFSLSLN